MFCWCFGGYVRGVFGSVLEVCLYHFGRFSGGKHTGHIEGKTKYYSIAWKNNPDVWSDFWDLGIVW